MTARRLCNATVIFGVAAFAAIIIVPMVAFLVRAIGDWGNAAGASAVAVDGVLPSERQLAIMLRTFAMVIAAIVTTLVVSLPAAYAVGRIGHAYSAPMSAVSVVIPLMVSPMVLAFGWQSLWGPYTAGLEQWSPYVRCVWNWSMWAWPIPAVIIGAGWSRLGRQGYESALLFSSPLFAFVSVVLPNLLRHVLASALVLGVVFLGEYTVPHAHGLIVISTEMLAAGTSVSPVESMRLAWPVVLVVVLLMFLVLLVSRATPQNGASVVGDGTHVSVIRSLRGSTVVVGAMIVVSVGVPVLGLSWRPAIVAEMSDAFATYHWELVGTLSVCLGVGVFTAVIGVGCAADDRLLVACMTVACLPALAPGALVGEAALCAYQSVDWIYNYWPIIVVGLTARYAWIGLIAAWLALRSESRSMMDQAALDVNHQPTSRITVTFRHHWPVILCGGFIAFAMAVANVDVVSLVQVPEPRMISTILIEKFHRFETAMLVSLSLWMVAAVVPGAILAGVALRRRA